MEQYKILGRVGEGAHGIVSKAKHIEVWLGCLPTVMMQQDKSFFFWNHDLISFENMWQWLPEWMLSEIFWNTVLCMFR